MDLRKEKGNDINYFKIFEEIFKREIHFLLHIRRKFLVFCIFFPLATFIILTGVFNEPVLRELPIAVIDNDRTDVSRELVNKVNASTLVDVAYSVTTNDEAKRLISKGEVYGVLIIPANFSSNVLGRKGAKVNFQYNNHLFLMGSIVRKGVTAAVQDFSGKYNRIYAERSGSPSYAAKVKAQPIIFNDRVLFNPYINYSYFFLLGLFPAFLQLFVIGTVVYAFYFEFKAGIFKEIVPSVIQAPLTSYLAKTLPYILLFGFIISAMLFIMFYYIGAPFRSGFWIVMLSSFLFLMTSITTGTFLALVLRHASFSATAIYAAPAFAYAGVTFPPLAMPSVAAAWSFFMPLSHYHKILVNETMRGAQISISSSPLDTLYLLVFSFLCFLISVIAMRFTASHKKLWSAG